MNLDFSNQAVYKFKYVSLEIICRNIEMKWNEMKSLLSLEGLRPPLSRDSSTYTHAMSYFACMEKQMTSREISKIRHW